MTPDPIRRQVIPRAGEMQIAAEELLDPVGEENTSPVRASCIATRSRSLFSHRPLRFLLPLLHP